MCKNYDFLGLFGWMLDACKGNLQEAMLYALIFKHSQDDGSTMLYSYERMAYWSGAKSVLELDKLLNGLVDKGLITFEFSNEAEDAGYARFKAVTQ